MADIAKKTKRYPTDLTDDEWERMRAFMPKPSKRGRKPSTDLREVLPRRWVVERTFGWMTRWRRHVRDYEKRIDVSKAMIHVAMGSLLWRRIVH